MTSLHGQGFVAIWNGVSSGHEVDFQHWHEREHIPERLAIPGFMSGARWRAEEPAGGYFTLYQLEHPSVASSEAYLERLNAPTLWTREIMSYFQDNARCVGSFLKSAGDPPSSRIAVVRIQTASEGMSFSPDEIMAIPGVLGCHLGLSDAKASSLATKEREGRRVEEPIGLIVVSFDTEADADAATDDMKSALHCFPSHRICVFRRELVMP